MMKTVLKGWVNGKVKSNDVFEWDYYSVLAICHPVDKKKGRPIDWGKTWPPRRVIITVEVED